MASRQGRSNRIYNWHAFPFQLDGRATIGSSGAPTLVTSSTITGSSPTASTQQSQGIKSITRLSAGIYRLQLDDNFTSLLDFDVFFTCPVTGNAIAVDATTAGLSTSTVYQIVTVGTTTTANWHTLGVPAGITPAVGVVFKAATTGTGASSGAGTVKALAAPAASYRAAVLGASPDKMLNNQPFTQGQGGGYITFMTIGPASPGTGSPDATPTATDPDSGTTMYFRILLSNSSVG